MSLPRHQYGFSLVSALFLMVVLAALGAYMVSLSGTQHFTTMHALQGAKAYHAARSGIEWGITSAVAAGSCPATTTLNTLGGGLSGFEVTVSCSSNSYTEKGNTFNVYTIQATGQTITPTFGNPGYASRRMTATITDAP